MFNFSNFCYKTYKNFKNIENKVFTIKYFTKACFGFQLFFFLISREIYRVCVEMAIYMNLLFCNKSGIFRSNFNIHYQQNVSFFFWSPHCMFSSTLKLKINLKTKIEFSDISTRIKLYFDCKTLKLYHIDFSIDQCLQHK